eukprot:4522679-Amphidinium_carterae.1
MKWMVSHQTKVARIKERQSLQTKSVENDWICKFCVPISMACTQGPWRRIAYDLWSMGVLMLEMLLGIRNPFTVDNRRWMRTEHELRRLGGTEREIAQLKLVQGPSDESFTSFDKRAANGTTEVEEIGKPNLSSKGRHTRTLEVISLTQTEPSIGRLAGHYAVNEDLNMQKLKCSISMATSSTTTYIVTYVQKKCASGKN